MRRRDQIFYAPSSSPTSNSSAPRVPPPALPRLARGWCLRNGWRPLTLSAPDQAVRGQSGGPGATSAGTVFVLPGFLHPPPHLVPYESLPLSLRRRVAVDSASSGWWGEGVSARWLDCTCASRSPWSSPSPPPSRSYLRHVICASCRGDGCHAGKPRGCKGGSRWRCCRQAVPPFPRPSICLSPCRPHSFTGHHGGSGRQRWRW